MRSCLRWSGWLAATVPLWGCGAGGAEAGGSALRPPLVVVDTEAPLPPSTPTSHPAATATPVPRAAVQPGGTAPPPSERPAAVADVSPRAPEPPAGDEDTKDPFNSQSVDDNREGTYIIERALTMPVPDPPSD